MEDEILQANLEFYNRKREFVSHKRRSNEYIIMYRTYHGETPSQSNIEAYSREIGGLDLDIDEDEKDYEEYHDEDDF